MSGLWTLFFEEGALTSRVPCGQAILRNCNVASSTSGAAAAAATPLKGKSCSPQSAGCAALEQTCGLQAGRTASHFWQHMSVLLAAREHVCRSLRLSLGNPTSPYSLPWRTGCRRARSGWWQSTAPSCAAEPAAPRSSCCRWGQPTAQPQRQSVQGHAVPRRS